MTTATLETKRFTLQVGDQLIELPEASSRNEALRLVGLTPQHWTEKPAKQRQQGKATAKRQKATTYHSRHVKKPVPRTKNSKKPSKQSKPVTVTTPVTLTCNANFCLFCGKPILALRKTKHYCNGKCRIADFRKRRPNKK